MQGGYRRRHEVVITSPATATSPSLSLRVIVPRARSSAPASFLTQSPSHPSHARPGTHARTHMEVGAGQHCRGPRPHATPSCHAGGVVAARWAPAAIMLLALLFVCSLASHRITRNHELYLF
jgi:hypothetical protein